jgi:hypothetical protein
MDKICRDVLKFSIEIYPSANFYSSCYVRNRVKNKNRFNKVMEAIKENFLVPMRF